VVAPADHHRQSSAAPLEDVRQRNRLVELAVESPASRRPPPHRPLARRRADQDQVRRRRPRPRLPGGDETAEREPASARGSLSTSADSQRGAVVDHVQESSVSPPPSWLPSLLPTPRKFGRTASQPMPRRRVPACRHLVFQRAAVQRMRMADEGEPHRAASASPRRARSPDRPLDQPSLAADVRPRRHRAPSLPPSSNRRAKGRLCSGAVRQAQAFDRSPPTRWRSMISSMSCSSRSLYQTLPDRRPGTAPRRSGPCSRPC